jgi:hypothetical protein
MLAAFSARADDDDKWSTWSADGKTELRQSKHDGRCHVECVKPDGARAWEAVGTCLATPGERRFVSSDCERTVVLIPSPLRGKPWSATEVMRVYARDHLDYAVQGAAVVDEKVMKSKTSWIAGCYGQPGDEPRYSADGLSVDYDSVDGKHRTVSLVAPPLAPPTRPKPVKKHKR